MCFIKPIPQYKVRPSTKKVISTITATTVALSILGKNVTHSIQWLADPMTCRWSTNKKTEKDNLKIHIEKTTKYDSKRPIRMKSKKKKTQPRQSHQRGPQMQQKKHENRTQGCGLLRTCTATEFHDMLMFFQIPVCKFGQQISSSSGVNMHAWKQRKSAQLRLTRPHWLKKQRHTTQKFYQHRPESACFKS